MFYNADRKVRILSHQKIFPVRQSWIFESTEQFNIGIFDRCKSVTNLCHNIAKYSQL